MLFVQNAVHTHHLHNVCRRPFAEAALRAAGELVPEVPPGKRWLPFGPGLATQWPPTSAVA